MRVIVVYKDYNDVQDRYVTDIKERPGADIKECIEDAACEIFEEGLFWVSERKIIPPHRVLGIEIEKNDPKPKPHNPKRKTRQSRKKKRNSGNNAPKGNKQSGKSKNPSNGN